MAALALCFLLAVYALILQFMAEVFGAVGLIITLAIPFLLAAWEEFTYRRRLNKPDYREPKV